jgi:hypothetical protein
MGVLFMGTIPCIVLISNSDYTLTDVGLNLKNFKESLLYISAAGTFILVVNFFVSKNKTNLAMYPQMRVKEWNRKTIILNTISWTAYLVSYELMYRGLLFIGLLSCIWILACCGYQFIFLFIHPYRQRINGNNRKFPIWFVSLLCHNFYREHCPWHL